MFNVLINKRGIPKNQNPSKQSYYLKILSKKFFRIEI